MLRAVQPVLHRRPLRGTRSPRACSPWSGTGSGPLADERVGRRDARAVPGHGARRDAARPAELAVPAGALPRLLRRLRPRAGCSTRPALEDAGAGAHCAPRAGIGSRDGDGGGRGDARRADRRGRLAGLAAARLRAGRGAVPEHPHAAQRRSLPGDRRGPRGEPRHDRRAAERPRLAAARAFAEIRAHSTTRRIDWRPSTRSSAGPTPARAASTTTSATRRRQPHLVPGAGLREDPGSFHPASAGFVYRPKWRIVVDDPRRSVLRGALQMRYAGLDPPPATSARGLRGRTPQPRCCASRPTTASRSTRWLKKRRRWQPVEFDVPTRPPAAASSTLTWTQNPGAGGAGRGNQVAEVWLMRVPPGRASEPRIMAHDQDPIANRGRTRSSACCGKANVVGVTLTTHEPRCRRANGHARLRLPVGGDGA